jgi:uncharacterized protein YjdB
MSRLDSQTTLLLLAFPFWLAMTLGMSSCALYEDVEPLDRRLAITELQISPTPVRLELGQSTQLSIAAFDQAGDEVEATDVEWTSGNTSVTTVAADGMVQALAVGSTTVTARVGEVTEEVTVVVFTPINRIEVSPDPAELDLGTKVQMSATVFGEDDSIVNGREIEWSSSAEEIASIDAEGEVTGVSVGDATIRAKTSGVTGTASIRVRTAVDRIKLDQTEVTVEVTESTQLTALVYDVNDQIQDARIVNWSSSKPEIASVDSSGLIEGLKGGQATIVAESGGKRAEAIVTVDDPVASVDISPSPASVDLGGTAQLSVTLTDAAGNELSGRDASWQSDDLGVATVDDDGRIHGVTVGQVIVTATSENVSDTVQVSVEEPVATVEISPSMASIEVAESVALTVTVKNSGGTVVTGEPVMWTSLNPTVVTIDTNGNIEGQQAGSATITAQVDTVTGMAEVTVTNPVRTVTVSGPSSPIEVTETLQLAVELADNGGNVLSGRSVTWTTMPSSVATVDTNGLVTAQKGGAVTITAQSEGVSDDLTVTVEDPPRSVDVTPDPASVDVGSTQQLSATVRDLGGNALSGFSPMWSSMDEPVATVDSNGLVTGEQGGSATITAVVDDGNGNQVMGTATVNVGAPVANVVVNPTALDLFVGEQAQINVTVEDANGNTLSGPTVTWTSQDTNIATVDSSGLVDAVAVGTATITAESGGVSATVTVEVVEWTQISAGRGYSCAVVSSGDGYCWGMNSPDGVLGNGTTDSGTFATPMGDADKDVPSLIQGGHDFQQIEAGLFHTCGLDTTGQVYCWGANGAGHLGSGASAPSAVPVAVSGSYTFVDISLGANHACALEASGNLYCWGSNQDGQLGLGSGSTSSSRVPQRVPNLTVAEFSAGASHTCATSTAGDTYCWGSGGDGEIGDGNNTTRMSPTQISGAQQFTNLTAGWGHTCALNASSEVYCWGSNVHGELGDGTTNSSPTPLLADASHTYTELALGLGATCGIDTNMDVFCWGFNGQGNLGTGSPSGPKFNPVLLTGGYGWTHLALGRQHTCGLASGEFDAFCWGDNDNGQLGNGGTQNYLATPNMVLTP